MAASHNLAREFQSIDSSAGSWLLTGFRDLETIQHALLPTFQGMVQSGNHPALRESPKQLLRNIARYSISYSLTILASQRKTPPPSNVTHAAVEFLLFCFEKATHSQEYAREVANPAGVRKLGDALLLLAGNDALDLSVGTPHIPFGVRADRSTDPAICIGQHLPTHSHICVSAASASTAAAVLSGCPVVQMERSSVRCARRPRSSCETARTCLYHRWESSSWQCLAQDH